MQQYIRLMLVFSFVAVLGVIIDCRILHAGDWMPRVPQKIGDWTGTDRHLSEAQLATLGNPRYVARDYASPAGDMVGLTVLAASSMNSYHDPRSCSVGAGYTLIAEKLIPLDGTKATVRALQMARGSSRSILYYWLQNSDGTVNTEGAIRHDIATRIASIGTIFNTVPTGRRTCVVRVYTTLSPDDNGGGRARRNVTCISRAVYEALKRSSVMIR